jgi:hypothetical protein
MQNHPPASRSEQETTMTSIHFYDPKTTGSASAKLTPLPISALLIATWNLLEEAADLPQPRYLTVSSGQSIDLQFPDARSITRWALRFGGVLSSKPVKADSKGPRTLYQLEFDYYGIHAEAYAIIPAGTATT